MTMRCALKTWSKEKAGPLVSGAPSSYDSGQIHIGKSGDRLLVETFGVEFFSGAAAPIETADVILEFSDYGDQAPNPLTAFRLVDRTSVSVDGQVIGRYILIFPVPWPVPMGWKDGSRPMQPRLRISNIAGGCFVWRAWLATRLERE